MVSTRKKRQLKRKLLSQLGDFDIDGITGNAMNNIQKNTTVNESTAYQELIVGNFDSSEIVKKTVVLKPAKGVLIKGKGVILLTRSTTGFRSRF